MDKIRTLIIDDESLARQIIREYLEEDQDFEIVGECDNGFDGFKKIGELKPDLVFLDVMMPKLTGFEMLELVENPPVIIFSTAYNEYAIKAFEQNAIDYLLKPYTQERFASALTKAKEKLKDKNDYSENLEKVISTNKEKESLSRIAVRSGTKIHIIDTDQIHYLEAQDDYVKIHSAEGSFLKQQTMKFYESNLPELEFIRIHRSYIVRIKEIARVELLGKDTHVVFLQNGSKLNVSRSGYSKLKDALRF